MASDTHESGSGHGHDGPLSGDLPEKPEPWSPKIAGYVNTHEADRTDWRPFERQRVKPDPEVLRTAEALAARMAAERDRRYSARQDS